MKNDPNKEGRKETCVEMTHHILTAVAGYKLMYRKKIDVRKIGPKKTRMLLLWHGIEGQTIYIH